jgi:hypothetical protein
MNEMNNIATEPSPTLQNLVVPDVKHLDALKPKGACWYCNAPLDNIRRFCNKSCAQDYQTEEEAFK